MNLSRKLRTYADGSPVDSVSIGRKLRWFANGVEQLYASIIWSTSAPGQTRTITLVGTSGTIICIDFGDGSAVQNFNMTGGSVLCSNIYTSSGTYLVRIYGALGGVSGFFADSQSVSQLGNFEVFTAPISVSFVGCPLTSFLEFSKLSAVESIDISSTNIVDITLINSLESLEQLRLKNGSSFTTLPSMSNLLSLFILYLFNSDIQTLPADFPAWDGINFRCENNPNFPTTEWLLKLDAAAVANSTLRADGTCPPHDGSAEVLSAIANLVTRGCTVTVNAP